jgi:hypothetical protein
LCFTRGKAAPIGSEVGVESGGPRRQPAREAEVLQQRDDSLVGRLMRAEQRDVVPQRAAEQLHLLGDDRDTPTEVADSDRAQVDIADGHRAARGVVQPQEQPCDRALPATRAAHQPERTARCESEIDSVKHLLAAIGERHVLECNRQRSTRKSFGFVSRQPGERTALREQLFRARHSRLSCLQLLELVDDPFERTANELRVLEQHEQRADCDGAVALQSDADREQERGADGEGQVGEPYQQAADYLRLLVCSIDICAPVMEPAHDMRAGSVGAHVLRGREVLFEIGEEMCVGLSRNGGRRNRSMLHAHEEGRGDRDEDGERETEAHVGHGQHDERADEQQCAAQDVDEERDEELCDRVNVAVDPLDHLAGWMFAVVLDVERQRVRGHLFAEMIRRGPRLMARHPRPDDRRTLRADGHDEVGGGDRDELGRRGAGRRLIDEVADDDRSEQRQYRAERERADESHER